MLRTMAIWIPMSVPWAVETAREIEIVPPRAGPHRPHHVPARQSAAEAAGLPYVFPLDYRPRPPLVARASSSRNGDAAGRRRTSPTRRIPEDRKRNSAALAERSPDAPRPEPGRRPLGVGGQGRASPHPEQPGVRFPRRFLSLRTSSIRAPVRPAEFQRRVGQPMGRRRRQAARGGQHDDHRAGGTLVRSIPSIRESHSWNWACVAC